MEPCAFCPQDAVTEVAREGQHGLSVWCVCESHRDTALAKGWEEV